MSLALIDLASGKCMASSNNNRFTTSLIYECEHEEIPAGKYIIACVPVWNEQASVDPDYKNIYLEILCPTSNIVLREIEQ